MRTNPVWALTVILVLSHANHAVAQDGQTPAEAMNAALIAPIETVELVDVPLREALRWWSGVSDVPVYIDFEDAELQGADFAAPVNLSVRGLPAAQVLLMILESGQPDPIGFEMLFAMGHDQYVEVLTKGQANRRPVTVVYDASELVLPEYDYFSRAPELDIESALEDATEGNSSVFETNDDGDEDEDPRQTQADRLAEWVRYSIEPDIWVANGGESARVVARRDRLIVRAPLYVQAQIPLLPITSHEGE